MIPPCFCLLPWAANHLAATGLGGRLALPAWRPFLEPLQADRYWLWFVIPMVLAISIVYRAIKLPDLRRLPREALWLSTQIVGFMILAAAVLWCITEWM